MADGGSKSSVSSWGPLLAGLAALVTAGVTIYEKVIKPSREQAEQREAPALEKFDALPVLIAPGEACVLRWETEYADTCSLEPGVGAVGVNGSRSVKPDKDTTYTLRCVGAAGEAERSVSVSVVARAERAAPEPEPEPQRTVKRQTGDRRAAISSSGPDASTGSANDAIRLLEELQSQIEQDEATDENLQTTYGATPVDLAYHCCDMMGMQRCPLVAPVQIGSPCFCPFQGTGVSCR
jgi:hypothetical protein